MTTVVVTGASGFLGKALVSHLTEMQYTVLPISRRPGQGLHQVPDYKRSPDGDILIHLAEESDRSKANRLGNNYLKTSTDVVRVLCKHKYQRIIYASSAIVYGEGNSSPNRIDSPVNISDTYSQSKLENEKTILDRKGVILRLSNLFGEGMSTSNVISNIASQLLGSNSIQVRDMKPVRDYLSVVDAVVAIGKLLGSDHSGIVNLGSGSGTSVGEIASTMLGCRGEVARDIVETNPSTNQSVNVLDISKTTSLLDWTPKITFQDYLVDLSLGYIKAEND